MRSLVQDLRYGLRMLVSKPLFSVAAISVLALGIGANTAVFSLINAFLLKPLAIHDAKQLVGLYSRDTTKPDDYRAFSYPNYADLRDHNGVFEDLAAHNLALAGIAEGDSMRRAFIDIVSSNFFSTLGTPLYRGRNFTTDEERPGSGAPVVIVSYPFWKKHGADPEMLGKTVRINGRLFTVVGIAAEGFTGTTALVSPELYVPLGIYESVINDFEGNGKPLALRDNPALIVLGRLRPGLSMQSADSQLAGVALTMASSYPAENKNQTLIVRRLSRMSISTNPTDDSPLIVPAIMLIAVAGVVLLIASLNVANMMLARGASRHKELAIRFALGASRKSIVQQLSIEGLWLSLAGGLLGLVIAYFGTRALVLPLSTLAPFDLVYNGGPDWRVLAVTFAFCTVSTLLFGVGPALGLSKPNLASNLKENALEAGGRGRVFSRRNLLVMAQLALSLMLLTSAGLFIRSSQAAANVEPGFRVENELIFELDPSLSGYDETRGRQFYAALLDRVAGSPGVQSAAVAAAVPFGMTSFGRGVEDAEAPANPVPGTKDSRVNCAYYIVSADYFKTLGIPLLQGRTFPASQDARGNAPVLAILDKPAAEKLWPHANAIGKHVRLARDGNRAAQDAEVIGVVGTTLDRVIGPPSRPHVYVQFGQEYQADMWLHIAGSANREMNARLLESVRADIRAIDPQVSLLSARTFRDHIESSVDIWIVRTGAQMFGIFGAVALLLAMVGLYGVRAYTVTRRTREIGIRMALGARKSEALGLILREGLVQIAVGLSVGLALSLAMGQVLANQLYRVQTVDPMVLLLSSGILAVVAVLACYIPARRAARIDPMVALREE
jgi:predicted permease